MDLANLYTRAVFRVSKRGRGKRAPNAVDTKRAAPRPAIVYWVKQAALGPFQRQELSVCERQSSG